MIRIYPQFVSGPGAVGLFFIRLVAGSALMFHGWPKIQNAFSWMGPDSWAPGFLQALAAFAEFGGGLALILGLLTPLACLGIVCVMTTAIFSVHLPKGDAFVGMGSSYELAAIYFSIALLLALIGPGIFALDKLIFGRGQGAAPSPGETAKEKTPAKTV